MAVGALLSLPLSGAAERTGLVASAATGGVGARFAIEVLTALVALALPTFGMGGTLPVLARLAEGEARTLGVTAGLLYAANTAGAALGALSVPFVVLPLLGTTRGVFAGAAANLGLAVIAWRLDRPPTAAEEGTPGTAPDRASPPPAWTDMPIVLAAVSGLVTFVLQVLWTRALAQVHENSTHSFALVVAVFILALAAGAQLARAMLRRGASPQALIGWAWAAGAALVAAGPWLFLRLTHGLAYLPSDGGWVRDAPRLALVTAAAVFPATTAIGVAFPALLEWAARGRSCSWAEVVGRVFAANVAGCVAGALLGGFLLPRWIGLWRGMLAAALLLPVTAAWSSPPSARRRRAGLAAAATLLLGALTVDWPRVHVAAAEGERLLALAEGPDGVVAVVERPGSRRLKLNNHYVLGGTAATGDERMQVHLPLLLHPAPRRVAVLGLGTGITAGGALFHPVEQLTAVELVPEVARAARVHLREANGGVLDDPRTRLIVADARAYLRSTSESFDVIVGDLVVPWRPGESVLFTREHFGAARRSLAPDGIFCQWLPLFQLSPAELRVVVRTFLSVFPRAQVWRGDFVAETPAVALVAAAESIALDPALVATTVAAARRDPANAHLASPAGVWLYFAGIVERADLPGDDLRVHGEEHPWLELIGPRSAGGERVTSRRLQAWLGDVRRRSEGRLGALGRGELRAMEAGEWLLELSLALSEGNDANARSAHDRLRGLLPAETFQALFPGA